MFDAPASPSRSESHAEIPAETRAERRMRRLEAMAEMGVSLGRKLERQAELASAYADTDAVPDNLPHSRRIDEIARAFAQVCRAVAVATALEDRIDNGLPALPDLDRSRRLREHAAREKRAQAKREMMHALEDDPAIGSRRRLIHLKVDLERLLDAEALDLERFLARPLPQLLARLRRDLGLDPDEDEGLWADGSDPSPHKNPSPERGRVTSGGPQGGPYAIADDLAIAARNAEAQAQAGPVRDSERGDGVTDANRDELSLPRQTHRADAPSSRADLRCAPAHAPP